jgi:DNA-binding NarL/FixJ family response regulator
MAIVMSSARASRRPLIARPWSPEDDAKILELVQQGKPPALIAAKLRRTLSAVRSRKGKLLAKPCEDTGTAFGT